MIADKPIRATKDSAIGLAQRNIEILARHRQNMIKELYVAEFEDFDICPVGDAYLELDLAFLRAIHVEADRAIRYQSLVQEV